MKQQAWKEDQTIMFRYVFFREQCLAIFSITSFLHLHRELNSTTDALLNVIIQWDLHWVIKEHRVQYECTFSVHGF